MRYLGLLAAAAVIAFCYYFSPFARPPSLSVVLIAKGQAHGSGVHLGHGFVLTAAHVVDIPNKDPLKIDGKDPKVIFVDPTTDIALLLVEGLDLPAADLACRMPDVRIGDKIEAIGNPMQLANIHVFGSVASEITEQELGPIKQKYFTMNGLLAPGMSGGPVFDEHGRIAGMADATEKVGVLGGGVPVPLGFVIPRSAICAQLHDRYGL